MEQSDAPAVVDALGEQAEDLAHIHDHITRVIANLDIPDDAFSGYDEPNRADYELEPVVLAFLYKEARDLNSENELARRLNSAAYIYVRFGLENPLIQATINRNWRKRFSHSERNTIKKAGSRIREICQEHGLVSEDEPALDPSDIRANDNIEEEQIMDAVKRATELGFQNFSADRASNAKYALEAYFERQGYLNMSNAATTTPRRRFARLSGRDEVPHGSSHNRTMKKVADPETQTELGDFQGGKTPEWRRIRDTVLPAFHQGVEQQLDEIAGRDRQGIRQPVKAAIDITTFNFWPSPTKDEEDVGEGELPVNNGKGPFYPKEDFPETVSGFKDQKKKETERGYKFATITIVAEDTPIILGIEPVRDYSWWERKKKEDVVTTSRAGIVKRLLEQAEQHVEIHKLFCDREFDIHEIRDIADRKQIQYVIGKRSQSNEDFRNIEEIKESLVYDTRIEHAWVHCDGRRHKVSIIYVPGGEYSQFTVNGWVEPGRAEVLIDQYRHRWQIENQYKSIKEHFLPKTSTKDYRVRFLYFVVGVVMHNVWRLTNFILRDEVEGDLGENPPLPGGEIVELVGFCLFDPGG
ncbi:transposase [Halobium palmae]|uniref:Transposase n=1 Tax=Halobium palmae TaxID=1776492 RepID=A0ABD5RVY1_9EURY